MSKQSANSLRPLARNKRNKLLMKHGSDTPPSPRPGMRRHPPLLHPSGPVDSQKARGAIWAVTWRTEPRERGQCKEVLAGKGGRMPLPVPLMGRPQARSHRVKIVYPTRRIRWVTTRRDIKTRNGYPGPSTKPKQGPEYTLLARAKNSTSLSLHLASCHRTVTAYTYSGPLHISRQSNSLHPAP